MSTGKGNNSMGKDILIAEARAIFRTGLRMIFAGDELVDTIDEVATLEEIKKYLTFNTPDLIVIHQSLATDLNALARSNFLLLATEPDKDILVDAYCFGACGYLLENASPYLLLMALHMTETMFLLDPAITPWLLKSIYGDILPSSSNGVLTTREMEIFKLMNSNLTNRAIGERLCISEATVKTHVVHIFRKLNIKRRPTKMLFSVSRESIVKSAYRAGKDL
jgi:DNA-binding NarL/FixJ family response regulator